MTGLTPSSTDELDRILTRLFLVWDPTQARLIGVPDAVRFCQDESRTLIGLVNPTDQV